MKKSVYASLAAALVLAGCHSPAVAPPTALEGAMSAPQTPAATYRLLGGDDISEAPIEEVRASSVRNDYFRLDYATDDNMVSAWSPESDDERPTLTFHFAEDARLSQMMVKLTPPGVTMDIDARMHGGEWKRVADDVAPSAYAQLVTIDLPTFDADYVRVKFNRVGGADVLLCDIAFLGVPIPDAKPKPKPKKKKDDCGCPPYSWGWKTRWGI